MNVSVINTKTNMAIGEPLISFVSYADESLPALPANNTNFNVTIPSTLGSTCAVAGTCVSDSCVVEDYADILGFAMVLVWHCS